tara:strand:+ start:253 stop:738 length:486 start_codon:yes stop_codon:yes gene_type:complete
MSKNTWTDIRGFKEGDHVISLDVDGLSLQAAFARGAHEIQLAPNCCVYKPFRPDTHESRTKPVFSLAGLVAETVMAMTFCSTKTKHAIRSRLNYPRRRILGRSHEIFDSYARNYLQRVANWHQGNDIDTVLNNENWGAGDAPLTTIRLSIAEWENSNNDDD